MEAERRARRSRDSSVDIVTRMVAGRSRISSQAGVDFLFSETSRRALEPKTPPYSRSTVGKADGSGAHCSVPSGAEHTNYCDYTSTPSIRLMASAWTNSSLFHAETATVYCTKLRKEKLRHVYCSPDVIRVIRWSRIRWVGHVARMGRSKMHTEFWWGNLKRQLGRRVHRWEGNITLILKME